LKQKKRPVLDITGFFFRMSTQVKAEVRMRKKKPVISNWKTLKYLTMNENRKDVDRYKFVVLFLLIVVLFDFLNIKSVNIYAIPYIFSTTLLLYKLDTLLLINSMLLSRSFKCHKSSPVVCLICYYLLFLYCENTF
jgi:hypothetical protein